VEVGRIMLMIVEEWSGVEWSGVAKGGGEEEARA
jgi:hypothetical protein